MPTTLAFCTKDNVRLRCNSLDSIPLLLTSCPITDDDRTAEYDMKLMDIDADTLGIPDTDYDARVTMPAPEFTRIVRDLSSLGESVRIEVSKEGVRFSSDGEAAQGNVLLKQTDAARERYENYGKEDKDDVDVDVDVDEVKDDDDDVAEVKEEDVDEKPKKVKKEEKVKKEDGVEDEDEEMASGEDEAEFQVKSEDEASEPSDNEKKKRKRPATSSSVRFLHLIPCERLVTDCTGLESKKESQEGSWHLRRRQGRRGVH